MSISIDAVGLGNVLPGTVIRAQDAFAAAQAAQAARAQSAYGVSQPQQAQPQSGVAMAQITQRAGSTVAILRQNEPNNPLLPLADSIQQILSAANGDLFSALGDINQLRNAYTFAANSSGKLLESPLLTSLQ